jgi:hypothetical protein
LPSCWWCCCPACWWCRCCCCCCVRYCSEFCTNSCISATLRNTCSVHYMHLHSICLPIPFDIWKHWHISSW